MTIEDFEKYNGQTPRKNSCKTTSCSPHTNHMGAVEHDRQIAGAYGYGYAFGMDMYDGDDDYFRHVAGDSVRHTPRDHYGFPLAERKVTIIEPSTHKEK